MKETWQHVVLNILNNPNFEFDFCTTITSFLNLPNGTEAIICNGKVNDWSLKVIFWMKFEGKSYLHSSWGNACSSCYSYI